MDGQDGAQLVDTCPSQHQTGAQKHSTNKRCVHRLVHAYGHTTNGPLHVCSAATGACKHTCCSWNSTEPLTNQRNAARIAASSGCSPVRCLWTLACSDAVLKSRRSHCRMQRCTSANLHSGAVVFVGGHKATRAQHSSISVEDQVRPSLRLLHRPHSVVLWRHGVAHGVLSGSPCCMLRRAAHTLDRSTQVCFCFKCAPHGAKRRTIARQGVRRQ